MSLVSVIWTLLRSPDLKDVFDLDCILIKGDQMFKFIVKFRYLEIEDLSQVPQVFDRKHSSVKREFLEKQDWRNYSWCIFTIYLKNCKWYLTNWDWCSTYC